MIKYITGYRQACTKYNTETDEINEVSYMNTHIDWMYRIPEDGEFNMAGKKASVKKDDIVIKFYQYMTEPFIVISNPEWVKVIDDSQKREDEENKKCPSGCDDCERCLKAA